MSSIFNSISVALCTYNGERFLQQQLESLADQSTLPDELIICDDASSDGTIAIVENFAKSSKFKVLIYQNSENLGYVKNFERAISLCRGDIIFLCDQDDVWMPRKIQELVEVFNSEPCVGLILHGYKKIDSIGGNFLEDEETYGLEKLTSSRLPEEVKNKSIEVFLLPESRAWCGCMMAFRGKFKSVVLPIFPGKGHDDWILKIIAPLSDIRFNSKKLIEYRMHERNTNSLQIKRKTFLYSFSRMIKRFERVFKGYSKRNFYKSIIGRIDDSEFDVRHPEIIKIYKIYT
jgi:glycosyltransferase involved in cell wall biosynthesis